MLFRSQFKLIYLYAYKLIMENKKTYHLLSTCAFSILTLISFLVGSVVWFIIFLLASIFSIYFLIRRVPKNTFKLYFIVFLIPTLYLFLEAIAAGKIGDALFRLFWSALWACLWLTFIYFGLKGDFLERIVHGKINLATFIGLLGVCVFILGVFFFYQISRFETLNLSTSIITTSIFAVGIVFVASGYILSGKLKRKTKRYK